MKITDTLKYHNIKVKFCYDTNDPSGLGCIREIIKNDEYNLYKYSNKEGVIIDIGGNHGLCTCILSIQNPNAKIYVLEPYPVLVKKIDHNLKINNCKNVIIINKALGDGNKVKLFISNACSGASSTIVDNIQYFSDRYGGSNNIDLDSITFDELIDEYNINDIELLKIDCEGAEYYLYESEKFKSYIVKNITGEFHNLRYNLKKNQDWNYQKLTKYVKKYVKGIIKLSYLTIDGRVARGQCGIVG